MTTSRLALFLCAATALAGCGGDEEQPAPVPQEALPTAPAEAPPSMTDAGEEAAAADAAPAPTYRAAVTDTLGAFGGEVTGLAVWSHPSLSFESAVLAANGEAGLAVVPIDTEVELATTSGSYDAVTVSYPGEGPALVVAAQGPGVAFGTLGEDRTFAAEDGALTADGPLSSLCAAGSTVLMTAKAGETLLYRRGDESGPVPVEIETPMACAGTKDAFYVLSGGGLSRIGADGATSAAQAGFGEAAVTQLTAVQTGTDEGYLLGADAEGQLYLSAFPAGDALAPQPITVTRDGEPLGPLSALAAGSGNFGSVYRDGLVAALTAGGELVLIPWAGLTNAAGLGEVSTVSLRPRAEAAPEAPVVTPTLPDLGELTGETP